MDPLKHDLFPRASVLENIRQAAVNRLLEIENPIKGVTTWDYQGGYEREMCYMARLQEESIAEESVVLIEVQTRNGNLLIGMGQFPSEDNLPELEDGITYIEFPSIGESKASASSSFDEETGNYLLSLLNSNILLEEGSLQESSPSGPINRLARLTLRSQMVLESIRISQSNEAGSLNNNERSDVLNEKLSTAKGSNFAKRSLAKFLKYFRR